MSRRSDREKGTGSVRRKTLPAPLFACLAWWCLIGGIAWADREAPARAVTRDGECFSAALEGIEADWSLMLRIDSESRRVAVEDLVQWGEFRDSDRGAQIVLNDGSWLIGDVRHIGDDRLQIATDLWGDLEVPRADVRGVIFSPSVDPSRRDAVRRQILEAEGAEDILLLENGDLVAGTTQRLIEEEASPGVVTVSLAFATRGREVLLPLGKISALIFNPLRRIRVSPSGVYVLLGLADGSRLSAAKIELPGALARLTLAGGVRLTTDQRSLVEQAIYVQPLGTGIVYLSDIEPLSYRHIPLLTHTAPLGRDRTPHGAALRIAGSLYVKGLGMPSASRAAYALRGRYRRFVTEVALDDSAGPGGSAVFRVFVSDGQGGWQPVLESPPVRYGEPPQSVQADLGDAAALALIVDMGERGDVLDRAVWLNARLIEQE